jgi:peptide/nickel transport system ATP-binding protein
MIKLEGLSKVYRIGTFGGKELHAVCDVDFEVKKGEVVSLIGESGSGKSTIGKMILRLIPITSGNILFDGVDVSTLKGRALKEYYRNVQGVFQDPFGTYNPIFKADRVFRLIREEFFPDVDDETWQQKVENALEAVGLNPENCLNKFPHQLSGGQLQRLLIARALLLDIKFLVADEIISMLDASTRIDVLNLLADLKTRGLSILFITHDLSLGYYISEKAVILYRGRAVEVGATEKIYANPLHPYTKMLMASVPRLDKKWENEQSIKAMVERKAKQSEGTHGCPYYERCPVADKELGCDTCRPPLVAADNDHLVACFHYQQSVNLQQPR